MNAVSVVDVRDAGTRMAAVLGLSRSAVGVRLVSSQENVPEAGQILDHHRYCQALMLAVQGGNVLLDAAGVACPAAAAAFGFRPLPEGLRSGKRLVGFGIVANEAVGRRMFELMPALTPGSMQGLHLFPLEKAEHVPDVVVEGAVEALMWISLAYLHATGGERLQSTTAVLQATCVDSTIVPYLEKRLNLSYGCYGCRDATDLAADEAVLGFPASMLSPVVAHLEYLAQKAIPASRSKRAWAVLQKNEATGQ